MAATAAEITYDVWFIFGNTARILNSLRLKRLGFLITPLLYGFTKLLSTALLITILVQWTRRSRSFEQEIRSDPRAQKPKAVLRMDQAKKEILKFRFKSELLMSQLKQARKDRNSFQIDCAKIYGEKLRLEHKIEALELRKAEEIHNDACEWQEWRHRELRNREALEYELQAARAKTDHLEKDKKHLEEKLHEAKKRLRQQSKAIPRKSRLDSFLDDQRFNTLQTALEKKNKEFQEIQAGADETESAKAELTARLSQLEICLSLKVIELTSAEKENASLKAEMSRLKELWDSS